MLELTALVAGVVGILGVIGSLAFNGWQARLLARQTQIQNAMAYAAANHEAANRMSVAYRIFIDYPELRQYFYDGTPCPTSDPDRTRVLVVSEMLGDVVGALLYTASTIGVTKDQEPWVDYVTHLLDRSPTLMDMVIEHPSWWPQIHAIAITRPCSEAAGDE